MDGGKQIAGSNYLDGIVAASDSLRAVNGGAMNFFKNIIVNLRATGIAAVVCVWLMCITVLGIFGSGDNTKSAITVLTVAGGMILASSAFARMKE